MPPTASDTTCAPDLGYRYVFAADEVEDIVATVAGHGFAIVKEMIGMDLVEEMRRDVLAAAGSEGLVSGHLASAFVESAPSLWRLLADERYLRLYRALLGADELTIHRSAAIVRPAGSDGCGWHTDMPAWTSPPTSANAVLNSGEWPNGMWFYLNGSSPERGGLVVIPDSHRPDWQPPSGYVLTADRQSFHRADGSAPIEMPGMLPMITAPNDLILFAARTYHAAYPFPGPGPRLSCGVGLRPRSHRIQAPWPLPASACAFIAAAPEHVQRLAEGYTGIEPAWRLEDAALAV